MSEPIPCHSCKAVHLPPECPPPTPISHTTVPAVHPWPTNAHLIADVARLGYLDGSVYDPTYGIGGFWTIYRPSSHSHSHFTYSDLDPSRTDPLLGPIDFTRLPFSPSTFTAVVFDPPYKLNGTPTPDGPDGRYGVDIPTRWQDRMALILDGTAECFRVTSRYLLVKCQDQVSSGKVRWQTDAVTRVVEDLGGRKVDRFDMLGTARPQPRGRRQVHAHGRPSTLLVFEKKGKG